MSGRFIVVEGIDGSGTSTQARAIRDGFEARGEPAVLTWEPTDRPVGRVLRELLAGRHELSGNEADDNRLFAYLFAADRHDHQTQKDDGVQAHLAAGRHVVCARYVLSSLAYEADDPEQEAFVRGLNASFPVPDLTVYLDCPVAVSIERITSTRSSIDVFENEAKLTRVRANYERLLADYSGPVVTVDATDSAANITAAVFSALD